MFDWAASALVLLSKNTHAADSKRTIVTSKEKNQARYATDKRGQTDMVGFKAEGALPLGVASLGLAACNTPQDTESDDD